MQRRHFKQTLSLEDRLLLQAEEIKKRADGLRTRETSLESKERRYRGAYQ